MNAAPRAPAPIACPCESAMRMLDRYSREVTAWCCQSRDKTGASYNGDSPPRGTTLSLKTRSPTSSNNRATEWRPHQLLL